MSENCTVTKMMRHLLILIFLVSFDTLCAQQSTYTETEFNMPAGEEADRAMRVHAFDGGDLVCATTQNPNTFERLVYFIKIDTSGSIEWAKRYEINCSFRQVIQCPDSGFVFSGEDGDNWTSYKVIKIDQAGNLIYSKRIFAPGHPTFLGPVMIARNNSNVYFASTVVDSIYFKWHWHVFELDPEGNVLSSNIYHSHIQYTEVVAIDTFSNGDLIVLGSWYDSTTNYQQPLIDRIDSSGALVWSKKYESNSKDFKPYCLEKTSSDNFYISGVLLRPVPFGYTGGMSFFKIDGSGTVLWAWKYEDYVVQFNDVITTSNSEICIIGGDMGGRNFFLRLDWNGNLISTASYVTRFLTSIDTLPGGNITMCGVNWTNKKAILEVTSPYGESCVDSPYVFTRSPFSIFTSTDSGMYALPLQGYDETFSYSTPNITMSVVCSTVDIGEQVALELSLECYTEGSELHINCSHVMEQIEIFDSEGKLVHSTTAGLNSANINITEFSVGVYIIQVTTGNNIISEKFLNTCTN